MIKLDEKDKKIVETLSKNGRAHVSEIAKKTGIPRDSVNYRLQRLRKSGAIRYFATIMDPAKMGYPVFAYVNITIKDFSLNERKRFESFLINHPKVVYGVRISGKYHYTIAIASHNLEHFDAILGMILDNFSNFIKDYDSSAIIDEFKYDTYSGLIE